MRLVRESENLLLFLFSGSSTTQEAVVNSKQCIPRRRWLRSPCSTGITSLAMTIDNYLFIPSYPVLRLLD